MNYIDFLKTKIEIAKETGFEVSPNDIHPTLKPHQRDSVVWAIKGGRRALFEAFGLGKTIQELEFCRLVTERQGGKALVVLPLGVKLEFENDAVNLLGLDKPQYVRNMAEIEVATGSILLTNYERVRDGDIDPTYFTATVLDEASVLRGYGSKTFQTFMDKFKGVPYKLVCTATPSPNKYKELIHYAGFLEVMDTGQALTRFFQRDSTKANNLTIYPHKEDEFWLWVSTWALFITKPSDLGYDDTGYDLPPLDIRYHELEVDHSAAGFERDGQMILLRDAAIGLKDAAREKRESIGERVERVIEIIKANQPEQIVVWCHLNDEQDAIERALKEVGISVASVYGSLSHEEKEQRVLDWKDRKYTVLLSKPEILGSGANLQQSHIAIFAGIDYSFNDTIQAVHRIHRFQQQHQCEIHFIYMGSESEILKTLMEKWKQHDYLVSKMIEVIKKYGLSGTSVIDKLARSIGVERVKIETGLYTAVNNDCVLETTEMPDDSVDLIHTSIPFGNHYEYTPSYNDFGHTEDTAQFFEQMDFLTPQTLRILKPGRVAAIHVKDRVLFGNATGTGMPTMEPFHALCIQHYIKHGFQYFGMITVVTDVVRENNQTYRLGWSEQCKDGTKMGVGCPEYILLFRKLPSDTSTAYADEPVSKSKEDYTRAQWQIDAHGYWRSSGDRLLSKEEIAAIPVNKLQAAYRKFSRDNVYSYEDHVEIAKKLDQDSKLPASFMVVAPGSWTFEVWDDINRMRTLNTTQSQRRQQMHVCPLQIDIVERIINRYSNPGDVVLDYFGGLMTVPVQAVKMGRKGYGIELNGDYFRDGVGYLQAAEMMVDMPTLFDFEDLA
ncbi:DNA methylase N-4 [Paenibacillus anaericanus]|uniref:DNA methylase N-4 n=1 Tax=Paenibacillus anaericanus TaxID=170367 RepID=A0A433YFA8_9BACL|nr:DNA methyltransferase [Paenibacillus anaericanus]RUT48552.1 DNA methylase N-4 [Paenibacillus anaericanus]